MLFRHEKTGPPARRPLRRRLQLLRRFYDLGRLACRDFIISGRHILQGLEFFGETRGAQKNKNGTKDEESGCGDDRGAFVVGAKPVHA
jgi:hypothetical protein